MNININRPEQCPYRSRGCKGDLCGYPGDKTPLYCDRAASAVGRDKFPLMCPLRREDE